MDHNLLRWPMIRFRYSGRNWEGRSWVASAAIESLGSEIETLWPTRSPSDGTVASKGHDAQNPSSDHRPKPYTGLGVVRAIDFGGSAEVRTSIMEQLRSSKDSRIKYVIDHETPRMFSSYRSTSGVAPWTWRAYGPGGSLPHVHVSVTDDADDEGQPWNLRREDEMTKEELIAAIWQALREGRIGSAETDPSILTAVARTYRMTEIIFTERGVADLDSVEEAAAALIDRLDDELVDAVRVELARRLAE